MKITSIIILIILSSNLQGQYLNDFFVIIPGLEEKYNDHVIRYGEPDSVLILWDAVKNYLPENEGGLTYTDAFALVHGNGKRPATTVITHRVQPKSFGPEYSYIHCTGYYPCYDMQWRKLVEDDRISISQKLQYSSPNNRPKEDPPTPNKKQNKKVYDIRINQFANPIRYERLKEFLIKNKFTWKEI